MDLIDRITEFVGRLGGQCNTAAYRALPMLAVVFTLAGCGATGFAKKNADDRNARFAVTSNVPAGLPVQSIGTTIFQNWERNLDAPDWALDRRLSQSAADILANAGGNASVVSASLAARLDDIGSTVWSGQPKLPADVAAKVQEETGASRLLLISISPISDKFFDTSVQLKGFGRYQRAYFGNKKAVNYLTATIYKLDLNTGKTLHWRWCEAVASRAVSPWFEQESVIPDQYQRELKDQIESSGEQCLSDALREMGLLTTRTAG